MQKQNVQTDPVKACISTYSFMRRSNISHLHTNYISILVIFPASMDRLVLQVVSGHFHVFGWGAKFYGQKLFLMQTILVTLWYAGIRWMNQIPKPEGNNPLVPDATDQCDPQKCHTRRSNSKHLSYWNEWLFDFENSQKFPRIPRIPRKFLEKISHQW